MRVFLAGASGVIGLRVIPLLVAAGHEVAGMTRTPKKGEDIERLGAVPVVCDVFDAESTTRAVQEWEPDLVMHQLSDLPDDPAQIPMFAAANIRIRREGTANLVAAARASGALRFLAQSVAWPLPGEAGAAVEDLETMVLDFGGVVLRYGQFYGPGTYYENEVPPSPRVHVDEAARRTVAVLEEPSTTIEIFEH